MASFTNMATLSYNGSQINSNVVTGELRDALTITKTAVSGGYRPGDTVTYVVTLSNTGTAALTGLTLTDDLGPPGGPRGPPRWAPPPTAPGARGGGAPAPRWGPPPPRPPGPCIPWPMCRAASSITTAARPSPPPR